MVSRDVRFPRPRGGDSETGRTVKGPPRLRVWRVFPRACGGCPARTDRMDRCQPHTLCRVLADRFRPAGVVALLSPARWENGLVVEQRPRFWCGIDWAATALSDV